MMLKFEKAVVPDCCCESMRSAIEDIENPMYYSSILREFGIRLTSEFEFELLNFCGWCGSTLPTSLRDEWFQKLENIGIDPWEDDIPINYLSSAWWQNA